MPRVVTREPIGCGVIEKRGVWWHFRWTDEGGRRHRESLKVTTKESARQKARALSDTIEHLSWAPRTDRKLLRFVDVAGQFVEHVARTAERTGGVDYTTSTATGYASILRRMTKSSFAHDYVGAVTPSAIESWLNARQDRDGISLATRNRELAFVKSVYRWAGEALGIAVNPTASVKIVGREEQDGRRKATVSLSVDELECFLAYLKRLGGLAYDVGLCAADTGLRRGSLQQLQWSHVDWGERLIRLPTSKSKKALEITLSDRLFEHLKEMFQRQQSRTMGRTRLLAVGLEDQPVFASPIASNRPFDNVRKGLLRAGQASGVGHVTLHMLRHSFCTQSADAGVPAFVLQEQMGHRNLSTTQRYYHASRQSKRIATETLERARDEIQTVG
jgi:integrase